MKKRRYQAAGVFMAALMLSSGSCGLIPKEETYPQNLEISQYAGAQYTESQCMYSDISSTTEISVKFIYAKTERLSFPVSKVAYKGIYVQNGDLVEEGQLLAELDTDTLEENLQSLNEKIEKNQETRKSYEEKCARELTRLAIANETLTEEEKNKANASVISRYDKLIQSVDDSLYIEELEKVKIEEQIEERKIYAPFSGKIIYVYGYKSDETSQANREMLTLTDDELSLFRASTEYWNYFREGDTAIVVTNEDEYETVVKSEETLGIEVTTHEEGEKGFVYFALKNTWDSPKDNATGNIELLLDTRENVLAVPTAAVSVINGESVVYYLNEKGVRAYKPVKLGLSGLNPDGKKVTEIISGLSEGESVIVK